MTNVITTPFVCEQTVDNTVDEIIKLHTKIRNFWSHPKGWAPNDAAELLGKSRLDRQLSLAYCLKLWLTQTPPVEPVNIYPCEKVADSFTESDVQAEGRLILAWANLGSLVEGAMKFFLCVFEHDYSASPSTKGKDMTPVAPDELSLEKLKQFFCEKIWSDPDKAYLNRFVDLVQQRRNAIHSYRNQDIGTLHEFYAAVRTYLAFLIDIEGTVPYPDRP